MTILSAINNLCGIVQRRGGYNRAFWLSALLSLSAVSTAQTNSTATAPWLEVIRETPYVYSQGFYTNLSTIRRWVLLNESYCEQPDRHILYDRRGRFLSYFTNLETVEQNQDRLNELRDQFYQQERVHRWIGGDINSTGYPFALRCDHPHANLSTALDRLLGTHPEDRVWGTWDGMTAGTEEAPIALVDLVMMVFDDKAARQGFEVSDDVRRAFLGQIIIESGARKLSFSSARAIGLLQLRPEVLSDCEIPERFYLHRMAQVDCAVRLYQQNDRNLRPAFDERFGHLPEDKRERLYSLMLVQAYHGGIGRMLQLLGDEEPGRAGHRFAESPQRYSAEDMATGLIYHNMGRIGLGLASLYYLVDVAIASEVVCTARPDVCP
ncbi:MAG: hypothetical protein LAT65_14510 [Saccharospirillum sp.]|nr:hypothetical protein [Saccharospirillum sp.]